MSGIITNKGVLLIEQSRSGGMNVEDFQSRVALVMSIMNHGDFGGGMGYGCKEHIHALNTIKKHVTNVLQSIKEHNGEES